MKIEFDYPYAVKRQFHIPFTREQLGPFKVEEMGGELDIRSGLLQAVILSVDRSWFPRVRHQIEDFVVERVIETHDGEEWVIGS